MRLTRQILRSGRLRAARRLRPAQAQQVTLDVLYAFPAFAKFHEPIAAEFMKRQPNIKIQFRAPAASYDEGHQTMLRQAVTNQLPDVYYSGYHLLAELVRTLAKREQVVDLDPLLAAEPADWRKANYSDAHPLPRPRRRQALRHGVQRLLADDVLQHRPREEGGRRSGQDARQLGRRARARRQDQGRRLGRRGRRLQRPRLAGRLAVARHDPAGRRQDARRERDQGRVRRPGRAQGAGDACASWSPRAACR